MSAAVTIEKQVVDRLVPHDGRASREQLALSAMLS